jgi:NAD(P)-dependent dehydrogenase (short-subunit alcohol dehydrogenase family)
MHLDLDSLDSVRAFATAVNALEWPVHCLINNAGVFDMSGRGLHSSTSQLNVSTFCGIHCVPS